MHTTVDSSQWPTRDKWPQPGWKHTLQAERLSIGSVFGFYEDGRLWSGIVEEVGTCAVKVKDILPGVVKPTF